MKKIHIVAKFEAAEVWAILKLRQNSV